MFKLTCNIQITEKEPPKDAKNPPRRKSYRLEYVGEIQINSSWEQLTDTAELTLPRKLKFKEDIISAEKEGLFNRGDEIKIELGYNGENQSIFEGFITEIHPGIPLRFRCEDGLWKLKQTNIIKTYRSVTLRQILSDFCPIPFKSVDTEDLGVIRFDNVSLANKLHEFKRELNLHSFVRKGVLYSGLKYWLELQQTHLFVFGKNIITADLQYLRKEDIKFEVEAISILPDNSRVTAMVGTTGGSKKTLHFSNIRSEQTLKRMAEDELENHNYEGYRGSFTCFGIPVVRHGDKVTIKDEKLGHAPGTYLVKKVETTFGQGGYRQKVFLSKKV